MFQKQKCTFCVTKSEVEKKAFNAGIFLCFIVAVITNFYDIWQFS